ncbi:MAG: antibiotic biosynthesis monooxygenase [Gemmatimonadota bacterium]|nr:antibiotic biosynthesis monooxygenase [Gemmatimonadota bacterium]
MICRTWTGWTTTANADAYETLLVSEIGPGIVARKIAGFLEIQVLRRALDHGEVEFTTLMWFDSLEAIKAFAGADHERAVVPAQAQRLLLRFDTHSRHAKIRARLLG